MPPETAEVTTIDQAIDAAFAPAEAESTEVAGDTNGQDQTTQPEQIDKAANQAEETAEENELLSFEERKNLTPEGKKAYKTIMKSFTQKTQALSEEKKAIAKDRERFGKYSGLIESIEADLPGTLEYLAKQNGYTFAKPQDTKQETAIDAKVSNMAQRLQALFGTENAEYASQMAKIFEDEIREVTKNQIEPIQKQHQAITDKAIAEAAQSDMKAFEESHKDYKEYEPKILELAKVFQPAPGSNVSPTDYLDMLYRLATADKVKENATTEVVERLKNAAKHSEQPVPGVKEEIVTPTAPKYENFDDAIEQAFAAAKKGIRFAQ